MEPPQSALLPEERQSQNTEESLGSRRAMNSTAYRIYKLLQWLLQAPLSVEGLNKRFCEDPLIGKPLSSDSIWLYINTLKALGCQIRRPSPKNQFCYELLSHPFGVYLNDAHFEMLSQAKAYAQQSFSHQEMLVLDRFLKQVVTRCQGKSSSEASEQLFSRSRSYDYADSEKHLHEIETEIPAATLLQLMYASPLRGRENFLFLAEGIFYEQGVVYIRGDRQGQTEPSNLRLERILSVSPVENEPIRQQLLAQRQQKQAVRIQIRVPDSISFEGFGLSSNQGVYEERLQWQEAQGTYEVCLEIRESFYLKQRLLACGYPFQVLEPLSLQSDLRATLEAMRRLYQSKEA